MAKGLQAFVKNLGLRCICFKVDSNNVKFRIKFSLHHIPGASSTCGKLFTSISGTLSVFVSIQFKQFVNQNLTIMTLEEDTVNISLISL